MASPSTRVPLTSDLRIKYYDLFGKRITAEEWHKTYSDPIYRWVFRSEIGELILELCWIGVAGENENPPLTYLVRVLDASEGKKASKQDHLAMYIVNEWFPSCETGQQRFRELEQMVKDATLI